jgi:DNA-binding transcriptional LysR family regulator
MTPSLRFKPSGERKKRSLRRRSNSGQIASSAFGRPSAREVLRVSAPTTFALRWLIPSIDHFHATRPQVEVTVTTTTTLHDELRGGFDVAIRRGSSDPGAWPQYQAVALLPEADTPDRQPNLVGTRAPPSAVRHRQPYPFGERDASASI